MYVSASRHPANLPPPLKFSAGRITWITELTYVSLMNYNLLMLTGFNLLGKNFVCDHRNKHPAAAEHVTPNHIATDQQPQPQFDIIQLD